MHGPPTWSHWTHPPQETLQYTSTNVAVQGTIASIPSLPQYTCKALCKDAAGWKYNGMRLGQSMQHNPGSRACLTWLSLHLEKALVYAA